MKGKSNFFLGIYMYELSELTKGNINDIIIREFGLSYDEFEELDFDKQQELIQKHRVVKNIRNDKIQIMFETEEHSTFVNLCNGRRVFFDGTVVEVGLTPEEALKRINSKIDEISNNNVKKKVLNLFKSR